MQIQKMSTMSESGSSDAAAQAAASQADALLDSIQMPCLHSSTVVSAVIVDASSSSSLRFCLVRYRDTRNLFLVRYDS